MEGPRGKGPSWMEALRGRRCGGSWTGLLILSIVALFTVFLNLQGSLDDGPARNFLSSQADNNGQLEALSKTTRELAALVEQLKGSDHSHTEEIKRLRKAQDALAAEVRSWRGLPAEVEATSTTSTRTAPSTTSEQTQLPTTPSLRDSFSLPDRRGGGAEIVIVSDQNFIELFYWQAATMRCYAWRQGYGFRILAIDPRCKEGDFFFRKHCTIAHYLEKQPDRWTVVVMDGDCVPVVMDRSIEQWLAGSEDLIFYEREWSSEVAAGNYVVRNTAFSREVLRRWAALDTKRRKGGIFHGADNGAIHVLLPQVLGLPCARSVESEYGKLSHIGSNTSDLTGIPWDYKTFVAAAELVRGPPRAWTNISLGSLRGSITILPRIHAWVVDHHATSGKGCAEVGSIFHHGVKMTKEMEKYFELEPETAQRCTPLPGVLVNRNTYISNIMRYLENLEGFYPSWRLPSGKNVPFHKAATHCCMSTLSCRPLRSGEPLPLGGGQLWQDPFVWANASAGTDGCLDVQDSPVKPACGGAFF